MLEVLAVLPAYFLIFGFVYLFFLKDKIENKRENLIFDNLVLGFVDALYLSGIKFGCTDFETRNYVKSQLSKAHSLPDNEHLFEYTATNGMKYSSYIGLHGDHMTFALLCIIHYAQEQGNEDLISLCENMLIDARVPAVHYH